MTRNSECDSGRKSEKITRMTYDDSKSKGCTIMGNQQPSQILKGDDIFERFNDYLERE